MVTFDYTIKDDLGIHARPAGLIVRQAKACESQIFITKGEKRGNAVNVLSIMSLGVKKDDTVSVSFEGADEEAACESMKKLFEDNL